MYERKILLGFMRVHILHHADEEGIYGAWMMDELEHHGYTLSPGTLYPILHEMERDGVLQATKKTIDGRQVKLYRTTAQGRQTLKRLRNFVAELSREVT
ncbi:MAG: PadR family transcriptional regulator [Thermoplasmatota archaeon]